MLITGGKWRRPELFLVTGGCGFIGSHLVEVLCARGSHVRVLDDLSTGKRANVPALTEVIEGDVADPAAVAHAMSDVDACFHLAAVASVARSTTDWVGTSRINLGGTVNVLDAARCAREAPIPVVFASSAAVYGNPGVPLLRESQETVPLSPYGADKRASELHAAVATQLHNVPCVGLRFFNVYGPRQDPSSPYSGVISRFADALARNSTIEIFGDGEQVRDFVFVHDVVDALMKAMERAGQGESGICNVCTGRATSIRELALNVGRAAGTDVGMNLLPPRPGDIRQSVGDPTKARDMLRWQSRTSLEAGLKTTLTWYHECLQH
ncbi:Epimerase [uncultured Defluviicoccus sp.]|uniref:Epimerase n=1 Tax=metagenome TaxID=256318 RepID=A0A380TAK5_9ZZZZ|nr:Epimerase [uncultured Defluviicoccus sp.]